MNAIELNNLSFSYNEKQIFNDLNLKIKENTWTTIVGSNGSGKSTLIKLIVGLLKPNDGIIKVNNILLDKRTVKLIRSQVSVVFSNPDNQFIADTVVADIVFTLENMRLPRDEIIDRLNKVVELLEIDDILNKSPNELSGGEKQLVAFASAIITNPKVLILDEAFAMIDVKTKEKILNILVKMKKEQNITIVNVTHDMEETTYGDNIVVIDKGEILFNDKKLKVYENEKKLKKIGLELPFMASLSIKLKYYGLVDEIILDMDKMVNKLWK